MMHSAQQHYHCWDIAEAWLDGNRDNCQNMCFEVHAEHAGCGATTAKHDCDCEQWEVVPEDELVCYYPLPATVI